MTALSRRLRVAATVREIVLRNSGVATLAEAPLTAVNGTVVTGIRVVETGDVFDVAVGVVARAVPLHPLAEALRDGIEEALPSLRVGRIDVRIVDLIVEEGSMA